MLRCAYFLFYNFILREGLDDGYDGDIAFASALETFGGETNDPDFMALRGYYSISMFLCQYLFHLLLKGGNTFTFLLQL